MKNDRNQQLKIGVFDSGAGAHLVATAIQRKIPDAAIIVKTDPEFFPYGDKTPEVIQSRLICFVKVFQGEGCQIVVIACNSATTNGIVSLRRKFPELLFVGIEPPVKPIVGLTKTGKVAVIGTEATIKSAQLKRLIMQYGAGVSIEPIVCPGLAEMIEDFVSGHSGGSIATDRISRSYRFDPSDGSSLQDDERKKLRFMIKKFLDQPIADGVDVIGLACTHYPYLLPLMKKLYPDVSFYDPTEAVVEQIEYLVYSSTPPIVAIMVM